MKDSRSVVENAPTYNQNVRRREWNEDTAAQKLMLFNTILGTFKPHRRCTVYTGGTVRGPRE
jgi:hypothetical protein